MKKVTLLLATSILMMLTLAMKTFSPPADGTVEPDVYKLMEVTYLWNLLELNYEPVRDRDDTWLKVGFRSKYAMAKKYASIKMLETAFGVPVFTKGPHTNGMDFNSTTSFGHYNPAFITKLETTFKTSMKEKEFRRFAKRLYKERLSGMAHTYLDAYAYLEANPDLSTDLQNRLKAEMASPSGMDGSFQETFRDFAEALEKEKGADVYEGFTAPAFWVRRSIDGTAPQLHQLLQAMVTRMEKKQVD